MQICPERSTAFDIQVEVGDMSHLWNVVVGPPVAWWLICTRDSSPARGLLCRRCLLKRRLHTSRPRTGTRPRCIGKVSPCGKGTVKKKGFPRGKYRDNFSTVVDAFGLSTAEIPGAVLQYDYMSSFLGSTINRQCILCTVY